MRGIMPTAPAIEETSEPFSEESGLSSEQQNGDYDHPPIHGMSTADGKKKKKKNNNWNNNNNMNDDDDENKNNEKLLAKQETRAVNVVRIALFFILLLATGTISTITYLFASNVENEKFQETFKAHSQQVIDTVQVHAQNKLEAIGAIALQIQAYAINMNLTWPFVTMPFFEETIMVSKSLTDAYGMQLFPIVSAKNRMGWEQYSIQNRDWVNQSYETQRRAYGIDQLTSQLGNLTGNDINWFDQLWGNDYRAPYNPNFTYGIASTIISTTHTDNDTNHNPFVDDRPGPYFPQWISAPMSPYYQMTVNLNYGSYWDYLEQTKIINETKTAAFGIAWKDGVTPGYLSTMLYPIFDSFKNEDHVVAFLSMDIYWKAFLDRILPPDSKGMYVVIQNTCNQTFTYQLHGDNATFVGKNDLHETQYNSMGREFVFGEPLMEPISNSTYTGRPLYGGFCRYTYHVYPSQQMEDQFISNRPLVYSLIVGMVFVFTSLVFISYDCLVEKRQRVVMQSANLADKIVSSLFPSAVKQRLYEDQGNKEKENKEVNEFMSFENPGMGNDNEGASPIAELYAETTVMFADLVGFTSWCSGRTPSDVFLLLETVYGKFDKIAKRRGVFKVETIGDCYVAVTGLPKPQPKHALIMVRFSQECQCSLRDELWSLAESLGAGTLELAMRFGLHSGPVTGGVLRGEKARFQLFGDTMNTAARMESNGMKSRIHVSESTAILLRECGKSHWVKAREDKIVAKGKGEMQTYWIDARVSKSAFSRLSSGHRSSSDPDATENQLDHDFTEAPTDREVSEHVDVVITEVSRGDLSTNGNQVDKKSTIVSGDKVDVGALDTEGTAYDDLSKKLYDRLSIGHGTRAYQN